MRHEQPYNRPLGLAKLSSTGTSRSAGFRVTSKAKLREMEGKKGRRRLPVRIDRVPLWLPAA